MDDSITKTEPISEEDKKQCHFTKTMLTKLECVKMPIISEESHESLQDQINDLRDAINYLANEVQKIYKYLKTEQDKRNKISSSTSIKSMKILPD